MISQNRENVTHHYLHQALELYYASSTNNWHKIVITGNCKRELFLELKKINFKLVWQQAKKS